MKTSKIFNIQRFANLCKLEFSIHKRKLLFVFIALIAILSFLEYWNQRQASQEDYVFLYYFILFVCWAAFSSFVYPMFRKKEQTMNYLLLPASFLEKVVLETIVKTFVFIIGYTIAFYLASYLVVYFKELIHPYGMSEVFQLQVLFESLANEDFKNFLGAFLLWTLTYVAVISFQKNPILKITAIVFGLFILFVITTILFVRYFILENIQYHRDFTFNFISNTNNLNIVLLGLAVSIGLLLFSYFKLKEKEV